MPPVVVPAADLVPWWFAVAFWLAFVALVVVVARDVHRLGGPRRVWTALRVAIERRGVETRGDGGVSEDLARDRDRE